MEGPDRPRAQPPRAALRSHRGRSDQSVFFPLGPVGVLEVPPRRTSKPREPESVVVAVTSAVPLEINSLSTRPEACSKLCTISLIVLPQDARSLGGAGEEGDRSLW